MSAGHFFLGVSAGLAILSVPVVAFGPSAALDLPGRVGAWIAGPPREEPRVQVAGVQRPLSGYVPGEPTPTQPAAAATVVPPAKPTAAPTQTPVPIGEGAAGVPAGTRTGVIRSGGPGVWVRRSAGFGGASDPFLAEGSPILVTGTTEVRVGGEAWRSIRALNGIAGWVPSRAVAVDGGEQQAAAGTVMASGVAAVPGATTTTPAASTTPVTAGEAMRVSQTDGVGVVLRRSPRLEDRTTTGVMEGATIVVLERSGADWARVRTPAGQEGWVPTRYLTPAT
jgi:SH3-like domain-containing protein